MGGDTKATLHLDIPQKLLDDLPEKGEPFIIGYVQACLQALNQSLTEQKYRKGDLLSRPVSMFDVRFLSIRDRDGGLEKQLLWPPSFMPFPPSFELAPDGDTVSVRELVNAMTSYFYFDNDSSIRSQVSCLECLCESIGLYGKVPALIGKCITSQHLPFAEEHLRILRGNLKSINEARNAMVHRGLRLGTRHRGFTKKGIGTLSYALQNPRLKVETSKYIRALVQQFLLLDGYLSGRSLDEARWVYQHRDEFPVVRGPRDLDDFMFSGLKIQPHEKPLAAGAPTKTV